MNTGALDSLVHYSILQLKALPNPEQKIELVVQIESWLERLKQVDPFRRERYDELGKRTATHKIPACFKLSNDHLAGRGISHGEL